VLVDVVDFVVGALSTVLVPVLAAGADEVVGRDVAVLRDVVAEVDAGLRAAVDVDVPPDDVRRGVGATERDRVGDEAIGGVGVGSTAP